MHCLALTNIMQNKIKISITNDVQVIRFGENATFCLPLDVSFGIGYK